MKSSSIRKKFLDYFKSHDHTIVPSCPLVPADDPTLLFTNAGMVQFKDTFLGKEKRNYLRATSIQRCLRAGGKHNDLENVGYTTRHHTFFEMLGNFSFGDYFKSEAISYAWEFLTEELKIPKERLWITVHEKDHEAANIWLKKIKIAPSQFSCMGDADNFWAMGETGPCGYCSEIYYDHGSHLSGAPPGYSTQDGERYVEIWNLVFMQFARDHCGQLTPLPKPSVDTGMGLERIAAVMQNTHDNYATDIFRHLIEHFDNFVPNVGTAEALKTTKRVVADHIRASTFLIADGVFPSNEGRDYVLRKIIRRAVYHLYQTNIYQKNNRSPFFSTFVEPLIAVMSDAYPELELHKQQSHIVKIIAAEEIKFLETLERGLDIFKQEISSLSEKTIPGSLLFNLYDTYGLPDIVMEEFARKRGFKIDQAGLEKEKEKQRERSRASHQFDVTKTLDIPADLTTEFVGYDEKALFNCHGKILALLSQDGTQIKCLRTNESGIVVLDKTPFYAESGGQVGDSGFLSGTVKKECAIFAIGDTKKYGSCHLHYGVVKQGSLSVGDIIASNIDKSKRTAITLNHSAAHLLHKALQMVLGEHAMQRGSAVDDKRLRFDFAHFAALTNEEKRSIKEIVKTQIRANLEVITQLKTKQAAQQEGATALFGEKYGDIVRIVTMGDFSKEFCGGTHVKNTGSIGDFEIISETAIAAGVRRIEVLTGENALQWLLDNEESMEKTLALLNTSRETINEKLMQLLKAKTILEKELGSLKQEAAHDQSANLLTKAIKINDVNILIEKISLVDSKSLRQIVDDLKQKLPNAVILLASTDKDNKIQLVSGVSKELSTKLSASSLLQFVAKQIDGSGGGRPDMAQGGGTNMSNLTSALNSAFDWVQRHVF